MPSSKDGTEQRDCLPRYNYFILLSVYRVLRQRYLNETPDFIFPPSTKFSLGLDVENAS